MIICNYTVYQFLKQFFSFELRLFQSILLTSPKPLWAQESRELCFLTLTECGTEGSKDRQVLCFPRAATETLSTEIKLKKSSQSSHGARDNRLPSQKAQMHQVLKKALQHERIS